MTDRLPDFLIVGAMKSATTTLYFDLEAHSAIRFPVDKEPQDLCSDQVLNPAGRTRYAAKYGHAGPAQLCGDASTEYTQMPLFSGVAERAHVLLGSRTRIIYIIRDPVDRALSHYRHYRATGLESRPLSQAVREDVQYVAFSLYSYQFQPWRERFASCLILLFSDLVTDRSGTMKRVCEFLSIPPHDTFDGTEIYNAASGRRRMSGLLRSVIQTRLYRELVRPRFSPRTRSRIRQSLLDRTSHGMSVPEGFSPTDLDFVLDRLAPDIDRYRDVLGIEHPWTIEGLRARHRNGSGGTTPDLPSDPPTLRSGQ